MKFLAALLTLPILAACGGSSSQPLASEFNADAAVVNACDSNYYQELTGNYDGQINYTAINDNLSCSWEVELQITSDYLLDPVSRRFCDLTMNMASVSSNPDGCNNVGLAGIVSEPLKSLFDVDQFNTPAWPIDADVLLNARLPNSAVYPVGDTGNVEVIALRFDGMGNAVFPATLNASPKWSGVLVKQ